MLIAQNPRSSGDADYTNGNAREQSVLDLAASKGNGLINGFQAFLANPDYATQLIDPDDLHPIAVGSKV